jgi:multidrug efflux pump subunit AcrA (membrane-fusion protein)
MPANNSFQDFVKRQPRWRFVAAAAAVLGLLFLLLRGGGGTGSQSATFAARRGPLNITVLEGGSLQAIESQQIKCEVRVGYQGTKILRIVEEGYLVTDDDVKNGKVLVELDSSEIDNQLIQQEIQFQSASASFTDARQNYEIQRNQNVSDIKAAEQKARFARMDFDKFLGESVAEELVRKYDLDKPVLLPPQQTPSSEPPGTAGPNPDAALANRAVRMIADAPPGSTVTEIRAPGQDRPRPTRMPQPQPQTPPPAEPEPPAVSPPTVVIDFAPFADLDRLGAGEAKQRLRKLEDDLLVAQKELKQATNTLDGTKRLFERGFVTRNDLERDEIAHDNVRLKLQTAQTAKQLYLKYEFVKSAEESLSKYSEAVRELDRAQKAAVSRIAQSEARLRSAEAQYNVQLRRRTDLAEQKDKCIITATKPGLVVYGGGRDDGRYYGGEEMIREGATVRERQAIITIPNLNRMEVSVKIHESYIKKVKKGQKAKVTIDAFPDQILEAEVTKVAVLPDSQNRWMNPDLKVYVTDLSIVGTHDWVKPGMSAKVEVFVDRLDDVVQIPVQAVVPENGQQVCYVDTGFKTEKRAIQTGQFNDEFIEIVSGLKEGEKILLRPPTLSADEISPIKDKPAEALDQAAPAQGKTDKA